MSTAYEITVDGFDLLVTYEYDNDAEPPWEECDGHGDVRVCDTPHRNKFTYTKKPGERPMNAGDYRTRQYYYDWAGACKKARKEGWNTEPYDAPNRVARAVQADFEYLRGWVMGEWEYVTVSVTLAVRPEYEQTVGRVETFKDYHTEFAIELAQEVIKEYLDDMEKNSLKGLKGETPEGVEQGKLKGVNDV